MVGRTAMGLPSQLLPLLEVTKRRTAGEEGRRQAKKPKMAKVVKGATAMMRSSEKVSQRGETCIARAHALVERASEMTEAISGVVSLETVSSSTFEAMTDILGTLARLSGDAADATVTTAVTVGEVRQHARHLAEALEAFGAGRGKNVEEEEEEDSEKEGEDSDKEDSTTPEQDRLARRMLLRKLNDSVASLQGELRGFALKNPSLLPAVSQEQKGLIFALLAEIMESAKEAVSRAWYSSASVEEEKGEAAGRRTFEAAVETEFGFAFAAAEWERLAVPSLEGRLLRLSALVDSETVRGMLRILFDHVLQLAEGDSVLALGKRLRAVDAALFAELKSLSQSTK